ncbi:hypothetical protein RDI58_001016 [Solanum bulbocastanum]|uniref:Uncharacterized protein n=1 Tax=Solanum bulbocastanum TaxID=147425 RepID=A0AAN8UD79_SOLBU
MSISSFPASKHQPTPPKQPPSSPFFSDQKQPNSRSNQQTTFSSFFYRCFGFNQSSSSKNQQNTRALSVNLKPNPPEKTTGEQQPKINSKPLEIQHTSEIEARGTRPFLLRSAASIQHLHQIIPAKLKASAVSNNSNHNRLQSLFCTPSHRPETYKNHEVEEVPQHAAAECELIAY